MSSELSVYERQVASEIKNIPREYLPNLLEIIRIFRSSVILGSAQDSFHKGWKEALAGGTQTVSGLWDGIAGE